MKDIKYNLLEDELRVPPELIITSKEQLMAKINTSFESIKNGNELNLEEAFKEIDKI